MSGSNSALIYSAMGNIALNIKLRISNAKSRTIDLFVWDMASSLVGNMGNSELILFPVSDIQFSVLLWLWRYDYSLLLSLPMAKVQA
mgnify:CR=1 FL=1